MTLSPKKIRYLCNKSEYWLPRKLAQKKEKVAFDAFSLGNLVQFRTHLKHRTIYMNSFISSLQYSVYMVVVLLTCAIHFKFICFFKVHCFFDKLLYTELHRIYHLNWIFHSVSNIFIVHGRREEQNHFDLENSIFLWLGWKELWSFKCRRLLFHKQDRISKTKMHKHKKDPQAHKIILRMSSANLR